MHILILLMTMAQQGYCIYGTSRVLRVIHPKATIWERNIPQEQINEALRADTPSERNRMHVPSRDVSGHGTHVLADRVQETAGQAAENIQAVHRRRILLQ